MEASRKMTALGAELFFPAPRCVTDMASMTGVLRPKPALRDVVTQYMLWLPRYRRFHYPLWLLVCCVHLTMLSTAQFYAI